MEKLIKNDIYTAVIEGYASDGSGVCRIGGRAVFVPGVLQGETCEVKILRVNRSAVYAKAERVISPSPERRVPSCPVFGKCGGCDLMHMSYEEELRFKLNRVNEAIERIGSIDFKISEIIGSDNIEGYRNKGIFAVGGSAGNPSAGFYRRRSHDIISINECSIQLEISVRIMLVVNNWCKKHNIEPYNEKTGKGSIRHIFIRTAFKTAEVQVAIVSAKGFGSHTQALIDELISSCGELTSIVLCINKAKGNTVLSGELYTLWGKDTLTENLCGFDFELSPFSFFQINPSQAEKLYDKALEYAAPAGNETVLDLYCGAGTISLCLSRGAGKVIGAEIVPEAVENAKSNAEKNGVKNVEFICADAGEAASELAARGLRPDTIVVDPPRKGLSEDVIIAADKMNPTRIVYVSCDPGTLARDLKIFASLGWKLTQGTVVDMFPRTANMETVVLLSKLQTNKSM